jgi:outer membrane lipoprotein-sorting protein
LVVAPLLPAAAAAPPAFISKIAAFEPKTIQCRVGIIVYVAGGVRMEMRLWALPPAMWRMDVISVTPDAPPQNVVRGMRVIFDGELVSVYDPSTRRVLTQRRGPEVASRPAASGRAGFTLSELLFVDDPNNYELAAMVPQTVEGRALVRYDFVLHRPVLIEKVLIARESIWVDPRGGEPMRAQLYDPAGRPVGIVALKDHRRMPGGVVLPMTVEMFLEGEGGQPIALRMLYQIREDRYYLPLRVDMYQRSEALMSIEYSNWILNRPIDLALFKP